MRPYGSRTCGVPFCARRAISVRSNRQVQCPQSDDKRILDTVTDVAAPCCVSRAIVRSSTEGAAPPGAEIRDMISNLNITAIVENTAGTLDAAGEWGLALWIEVDDRRILSDTGQGHTLLRNARLLGIDVATAEALVISHGHSDHTGGIAAVMDAGFRGKIYIHPAALSGKYQREKTPPHRAKGIPSASYRALLSRVADVVESPQPTEIAPGVIVTGAIPRRNTYEDITDPFFLDENCTQPDPLIDDQALLIKSPRGWAVITGCGHSGLINTLNYAKELIGNSHIVAVHRRSASLSGIGRAHQSDNRKLARVRGRADRALSLHGVRSHGRSAESVWEPRGGAPSRPDRPGFRGMITKKQKPLCCE